MTTDMKNIADNLPPCKRRVLYRALPGEPFIIYCKPPLEKLKALPASEAIRNPELYKTKIVLLETCQGCQEREENFELVLKPQVISPKIKRPKILENGTIIYKKEDSDWEPPPIPLGYKRESDNLKDEKAWVLIPEKPFCIHVQFEKNIKKSCGCETYSLICTKDGKHEVILRKETCQECPNRIETS